MLLNDFLCEILVIAIEKGIGYWAEVEDYRWVENRDNRIISASAKIKERDEQISNKWVTVDTRTIARGLDNIRTGKIELKKDLLKSILYSDVMRDLDEIDGKAADCILQAGIFGEVPYV